MKKISAFLSVIIFLILGCSFNFRVLTPAPVTVEPTAETIIAPIDNLVTDEAPIPTALPTTTDPQFYGGFIATEQAGQAGHSRFPAGTKQLFAVWNYRNMREGLTVKREWYLDNGLWLTREEPWDFAKYGVNGILRDISIHDFDTGLPSGKYRLIVSIDGVTQPIGKDIIEGFAESYLEFDILPVIEAFSPNGQWKATSLVDRLVLIDSKGDQTELPSVGEIVSVAWLDDQHVLFDDRDSSGQVSNLEVGIRDELRIVDLSNRESRSLYKIDTILGSTGGLYVSPNGKYVAGIAGSGFGDACSLDSQVIFFELADDYKSVKVIKQEQFTGIPNVVDGVVYPVAVGTWQNDSQYRVALNGTCGADSSLTGLYLFDIPNLKAIQDTSAATPSRVGDLGWGEIHGIVTDAISGNAIAGATVTCEHSSYTSTFPAKCSGSTMTGIQGVYNFQGVFFHDTDTIKLTVSAPGYIPAEFTQNAFTINAMKVDFPLSPLP